MRTNKNLFYALSGPILFAGSNLLISVALQQLCTPEDFGIYAFIQVVAAASLGISNGLFGIPIISVVRNHSGDEKSRIRALVITNVSFCAVAATGSAFLAQWSATSQFGLVTASFLFTFVSGIRWFVRLHALSKLDNVSAVRMDGLFSLFVLAGVTTLIVNRKLDAEGALWLLTAAAAFSLIGASELAKSYFRSLFQTKVGLNWDDVRSRGLAAVLVSVCFEAIATAPAYYLSLALGPAFYAPVALAVLLYRPYGVLLTAAMQYLRPRLVVNNREEGSRTSRKLLIASTASLAAVWLANSTVIYGIGSFFPKYLYKSGYDSNSVNISIALISAAVLCKAFREPLASVLMVNDHFRSLATASVAGVFISALAVAIAASTHPESYSLILISIVMGEAVSLALCFIAFTRISRRSA